MAGTINSGAGPEGPVPPLVTTRNAPLPPLIDASHGVGSWPDRGQQQHRLQPVSEQDLTAHRGLFGPGTVTWRIHSDPLVGLATLRSLALRVLHPEAVSGVFVTARRFDDPWDRLAWTLRHLGVTTFGSGAEVAVAGARMRAVLMQVRGTSATGHEYCGDDPELLLWLHCCQVASLVEVTRGGGLALTDDEHECYIREQQRTAAVWGLEPDKVPGSRTELTRYFRSVRPHLRMTAPARTFISSIIDPGVPEVMALTQRNRPAWAPVAGLAFASLPTWARRMYSSAPSTGPAALNRAALTIALHSLRDSLRE